MGARNFLVEGVSGTGKTSVCRELQRRGYHAVNGDTELAHCGDPETGEPLRESSQDQQARAPRWVHEHHLWRVEDVKALVADHERATTFLCGGSRNVFEFIDLLDGVFVLQVDDETLNRRLDARPPGEFGSSPAERDLILRLHRTGEDDPSDGMKIDSAAPLTAVVDEILRLSAASAHR